MLVARFPKPRDSWRRQRVLEILSKEGRCHSYFIRKNEDDVTVLRFSNLGPYRSGFVLQSELVGP